LELGHSAGVSFYDYRQNLMIDNPTKKYFCAIANFGSNSFPQVFPQICQSFPQLSPSFPQADFNCQSFFAA
jgi:hypothetical protein